MKQPHPIIRAAWIVFLAAMFCFVLKTTIASASCVPNISNATIQECHTTIHVKRDPKYYKVWKSKEIVPEGGAYSVKLTIGPDVLTPGMDFDSYPCISVAWFERIEQLYVLNPGCTSKGKRRPRITLLLSTEKRVTLDVDYTIYQSEDDV